jgi:hypothetical protein
MDEPSGALKGRVPPEEEGGGEERQPTVDREALGTQTTAAMVSSAGDGEPT